MPTFSHLLAVQATLTTVTDRKAISKNAQYSHQHYACIQMLCLLMLSYAGFITVFYVTVATHVTVFNIHLILSVGT